MSASQLTDYITTGTESTPFTSQYDNLASRVILTCLCVDSISKWCISHAYDYEELHICSLGKKLTLNAGCRRSIIS